MSLDNIKLSRNPIKYTIEYKWEGNDLYITLPTGYDQYLIYKKNAAEYMSHLKLPFKMLFC